MKDNYLIFMKNALSDLVSVPSVKGKPENGAPFGVEVKRALDKALDLARSLGFKTNDLDGYCGTADVGEGEAFGILAHLDVMPVGSGWDTDPFTLTEKDGKWFARGSIDDKGPAVCALFAVKSLLDEGLVPKKKIRFIFGCDEESGWGCMKHYAKVEKMPEMGFSPDGDFPVINCEKGICHLKLRFPKINGIDLIEGGQRANMVPDSCRVLTASGEKTFSGRAAHGSTPELGENAVIKAFDSLSGEIPELKRLSGFFKATDGSGLGIEKEHDQSGKLSMNLGVIKGDGNGIEIVLDIRHPVNTNPEEIKARIKDSAPEVEIIELESKEPLFIDKTHPFIKTLLSAYRTVTGEKDADAITIGGGTYARTMKLGVAFGMMFPNKESVCHMPNEYVEIEDMKKSFEIYRLAIKELCF